MRQFFFVLLLTNISHAQKIPTDQTDIDHCKSLEDDKPSEAIDFARKTLMSISPDTNPIVYGHLTGCLGWALAMNNQQPQSRVKAEEIEKLSNQLPESSEKSSLYMRAGGIFHLIGDRISAASNYNKAMLVAENLQLKKELIPILVNLGVLNSELQEHKTAIDNYNYSLELMKEINDFRYKPPVLFNLALTLNGQNMHEKGLKIFLQIEDMINEHWPKGRVAQVYSGLASSYMGLDDYKNARIYNEKTIELQEESGVQNNVKIMTEVAQSKILQKLGFHQQAKVYADKAYNYFMNDNNNGLTNGEKSLNLLANVYEEFGEIEKSLNIYKKSLKLHSNFQESFNKESIAQMQARLINSQQREELLELKHNNTLNKLMAEQRQEKSKQLQEKNERELMIVSIFVVVLSIILIWLRILNIRLKKITLRDSLTKLGNRRALSIWQEQRPINDQSNRKLWLIDLDNFKKVNDQYGHDTGDTVLIAISKLLMTYKNSNNFIGRWGGEEFILITDDIQTNQVSQFAKKLLTQIANLPLDADNKELFITASIGISNIKSHSKRDWETSLSSADNALYEAKDNGRNCFVVSNA